MVSLFWRYHFYMDKYLLYRLHERCRDACTRWNDRRKLLSYSLSLFVGICKTCKLSVCSGLFPTKADIFYNQKVGRLGGKWIKLIKFICKKAEHMPSCSLQNRLAFGFVFSPANLCNLDEKQNGSRQNDKNVLTYLS